MLLSNLSRSSPYERGGTEGGGVRAGVVLLETKSKGTCNPKRSGIWIVQIVSTKVEIYPENSKDIANPYGIFPVYLIRWCH
jgi:hypothetical protein